MLLRRIALIVVVLGMILVVWLVPDGYKIQASVVELLLLVTFERLLIEESASRGLNRSTNTHYEDMV